MRSSSDLPVVPIEQGALLLKAVELLVEELEILSSEDWERLPDLKRAKVVAASRLRQLRVEAGAADGAPLSSMEVLIAELDGQSRQAIRMRLERIGTQICALQELSLYLRECLHVTLDRPAKQPLGNEAAIV